MAKPMRVLSIDGGGIRGLIPASVLVEIEAMIQEREGPEARLADYFDLVAGTSTGGIIAGLLLLPQDGDVDGRGAGRPSLRTAEDVVQFYLTNASKLFGQSLGQRLKRIGGLFDARYGPSGFNQVLHETVGPRGGAQPEPMLSDLIRPTVITTYNATTGAPYFFKQHEAASGGHDFALRDVVLATASAPTYFEPVAVVSDDGEVGACVDGGVFANNPAMCAYAEAVRAFGLGAKDMAMLSIGTGTSVDRYDHQEIRGWGVTSWVRPLIDMMMASTDRTVDHQLVQIFGTLGEDAVDAQYLRLQADLDREPPEVARMDNVDPVDLRRLVAIGQEMVEEQREHIAQFLDEQILGRSTPTPVVAAPRSHFGPSSLRRGWTPTDRDAGPTGAGRSVPARPGALDRLKIKALVWMRNRHFEVVNESEIEEFRRRHVPTSGMPQLVRACGEYPLMSWVPKELMVPDVLPPEAHLPTAYKVRYYGFGKLGWAAYNRAPIRSDLLWDPAFEWNQAFPQTRDGWEHPTTDDTYTRLRLQGPNPFLLRRVDDRIGAAGEPEPAFEVDYTDLFAGIVPPVVARFAVTEGEFVPTGINVGPGEHHPGDPTWDQAKRVVNAVDVRYAAFGSHLLHTHLIVGAAFAMAAYSLPTWHRLRPFMQFFTYGTLAVNDLAYRALLAPGSYFIESGFAAIDDARQLFTNMIPRFDLDQWIAPRDITERGLDAIPDHPYVDDALLVWPAFVDVVERHLDELGLDEAAIAADMDLQAWYLTLAKILPNTDPRERPLDRSRLAELCTALLWNNIVHEICGDFSPIAGSDDPEDKAILHLGKLRSAVVDGDLTTPVEPPTMADVFLMDQASWTSRFNVGGNNILAINAAREVDDPKLRLAIEDLQATLGTLEGELLTRNEGRPVRFARMLPRHWEASVSF